MMRLQNHRSQCGLIFVFVDFTIGPVREFLAGGRS